MSDQDVSSSTAMYGEERQRFTNVTMNFQNIFYICQTNNLQTEKLEDGYVERRELPRGSFVEKENEGTEIMPDVEHVPEGPGHVVWGDLGNCDAQHGGHDHGGQDNFKIEF